MDQNICAIGLKWNTERLKTISFLFNSTVLSLSWKIQIVYFQYINKLFYIMLRLCNFHIGKYSEQTWNIDWTNGTVLNMRVIQCRLDHT